MMSNWLTSPFIELWRFRAITGRLCLAELRAKYAGMALGVAWLVLFPLVYLGIYYFLYNVVLKVRPTAMDVPTYLIYIFAGLITFLSIAETLAVSAQSLANNENMFKSTSFPLFIVPVISTAVGQISFLPGLAVTIILAAAWNGISAAYLLLPLISVNLALFLCGLAFLISLLAVVLKDLQRLITFLCMGIMLTTPIVFTMEMVPESLRAIVLLNPFYYYVSPIQDILAFSRWPSAEHMVIQQVLSIFVFSAGFTVFRKIKGFVSNYV